MLLVERPHAGATEGFTAHSHGPGAAELGPTGIRLEKMLRSSEGLLGPGRGQWSIGSCLEGENGAMEMMDKGAPAPPQRADPAPRLSRPALDRAPLTSWAVPCCWPKPAVRGCPCPVPSPQVECVCPEGGKRGLFSLCFLGGGTKRSHIWT